MMPVLLEALSVVTRRAAIDAKLKHGWEEFLSLVPNATLAFDDDLARVGFMSPDDVAAFVRELEARGLTYLELDAAVDLAVVDQFQGLTTEAVWLEFAHISTDCPEERVFVCRLVGSADHELHTPLRWRFEGSVSQRGGFMSNEEARRNLTFLRTENGLDVFRREDTGDIVYLGRTARLN